MIGVPFQLPIEFDLAAVFLFALTGVWVAARRGYDADVRLAFPDGPAIGLAFTQWRDPLVRERGLQLRIQIPIERARNADATPAARSAWRAGSS